MTNSTDSTNRSKIKTKSGWLTYYGLACGYVEQLNPDYTNTITMCLEPNGYHLKGFRAGVYFWEVLEFPISITVARRIFTHYLSTGKTTL